MTKEEAKKRLEIWLICMDCPEDKLCYDSHLHSLCEYTDYCDDVSISEAIKVAIEALDSENEGNATIKAADYGYLVDKDIIFNLENNLQKSSISHYEDIKFKLKQFLMDTYDIRPSLSEKTVEEMFKRGTEFISLEEQKEREEK